MDCRTFQRKLEDYLEGGLDFPGRFGMERHAQQCYVCSKEVNDALKLSQMARGVKRVGAPPDFEAAVLARIHARESYPLFQQLRRFWVFGLEWPSWRILALGVSSVVFLVVGIYLSVQDVFWGAGDNRFVSGQSPASLSERGARVASAPGAPNQPPEVGGGGFRDVFGLALSAPGASQLNQASQSPLVTAPVNTNPRRSQARYSTQFEWSYDGTLQGEIDYVEYLVPAPGHPQLIMRLPKTIRMRYGQASEEHFIRNVSH